MGFRFQKRIKILPGVTLNLSKSGVSTSFGPRGARYTVGHGKRRTTVGLPGSGLSYTTIRSADSEPESESGSESVTNGHLGPWAWIVVAAAVVVFFVVVAPG